jgi:hypothetical protein
MINTRKALGAVAALAVAALTVGAALPVQAASAPLKFGALNQRLAR